MSPRTGVPLCHRETRYGVCHRTHGHHAPCATFIGPPDFWFAWRPDGSHLGYGRFSHGRFRPAQGGRQR